MSIYGMSGLDDFSTWDDEKKVEKGKFRISSVVRHGGTMNDALP